MDFKEMARERYSVRKYSARPWSGKSSTRYSPPPCWPPTAKNQQPLRIYVLQSAEALEALNALTHCAYGARHRAVLFAYDKNEEWQNPLEPGVTSGVEDREHRRHLRHAAGHRAGRLHHLVQLLPQHAAGARPRPARKTSAPCW